LGRLLLTVDKFYGVGVDYAVTLTLNFKVVGNQVNRAALNERVRRLGWSVAKASWIASWRVAVSTLAVSRVAWFAVATRAAGSHLLLSSLKWSALRRVGVWRLHVLRLPWVGETGLALTHVERSLSGPHELIWAGVLLWNSVAVRRLVKILVVWLLHVI